MLVLPLIEQPTVVWNFPDGRKDTFRVKLLIANLPVYPTDPFVAPTFLQNKSGVSDQALGSILGIRRAVEHVNVGVVAIRVRQHHSRARHLSSKSFGTLILHGHDFLRLKTEEFTRRGTERCHLTRAGVTSTSCRSNDTSGRVHSRLRVIRYPAD